jgi:hypothetical protein
MRTQTRELQSITWNAPEFKAQGNKYEKPAGAVEVTDGWREKKNPNVFMKVCIILQEECKVCKQSGASRWWMAIILRDGEIPLPC